MHSQTTDTLLRGLFSQNKLDEFLEQHFLKTPFSLTGGCVDCLPLGSWEMLDRVLQGDPEGIVVGRGGEQKPDAIPHSYADALPLLNDGWTVSVRHAEHRDEGLARLATEFRRTFRAPIDIHMFCTPGGHGGFSWHYDAEDVFVLQTVGEKEWWLRKNTVNPWPVIENLPADMKYEREIMPVMRCHLRAGDWLYIPGGYWHRTQAIETSISLSVGILAATALDLLDFVREELADSLLWRQRMRIRQSDHSPASDVELAQSLTADLMKKLKDPETLSAFWRHRDT